MVSQEDIQEFILEHKKYIVLGVIIFILLVGLVVYLNTDFTHNQIYDGNQLFYDDKEIIVGFEDLPPSKENIRSTFSTFIRLNNLDGNTSWTEDQSLKKYIINNSGSPNIIYLYD